MAGPPPRRLKKKADRIPGLTTGVPSREIFCRNCGEPSSELEAFCPSCGTLTDPSEEE
jgi:hypothetical protein